MGFNNDEFDDFDFGDDDDFGLDDDFGDLADNDSGAGFGDDFADFDDFEDPDDFGFGEDEFSDADLDSDLDFGDDEAIDLEPIEEGEGSGSGFRRALAILGGLLVTQLIIMILLFFLLPGPPTDDIPATQTAVAIINATTIAEATNNAATALAAGTQTAEFLSRTPTPSPSPTNTRPPTFTPEPTEPAEPTLDPTFVFLTEVAEETNIAADIANQTATANAQLTADAIGTAGNEERDVAGTATAIFQSFLTATALAGEVTPMDIVTEAPTAAATALPDSGFFDNGATSSNLGLFALAAFALLGVIAFSRTVRMGTKDDE